MSRMQHFSHHDEVHTDVAGVYKQIGLVAAEL